MTSPQRIRPGLGAAFQVAEQFFIEYPQFARLELSVAVATKTSTVHITLVDDSPTDPMAFIEAMARSLRGTVTSRKFVSSDGRTKVALSTSGVFDGLKFYAKSYLLPVAELAPVYELAVA